MSAPLTADDLRALRLPERRWGQGYAVPEVDDLLDRAALTLEGRAPSPLGAADVVGARFTVTLRRGYAQDAVDDLLDRVADALRARGA